MGGGGERRSWKGGPKCRWLPHHCPALVNLHLFLTPSPLEAVSKRLAILENRIV